MPDRSFWDELLDALEYAWGPLLVAGLFAAALALPDATHEVLMVVADDPFRGVGSDKGVMASLFGDAVYRDGVIRAFATLLLCLFAPVSLYLATARVLTLERDAGPWRGRVDRLLLAWVPRLPLAGGLAAMLTILTARDARHVELGAAARWVMIALVVYLSLGVASGAVALLPERRHARLQTALRKHEAPAPLSLMAPPPARPPLLQRLIAGPVRWYRGIRDRLIRAHPAVFAIVLVLLALAIIRPQAMEAVGPIGLAAAVAIAAAQGLAMLPALSQRLVLGQGPLALVILGCILAGSGQAGATTFAVAAALYLGTVLITQRRLGSRQFALAAAVIAVALLMLGVQHWRRDCAALSGCSFVQGVPLPAETQPRTTRTGFSDWRRAQPPGETTPIRILAAQGGGLYAAYAAGMYLAHRADTEGPAFTESLFAVSGVSGGSVGAAAYWAVRRSGLCADWQPDRHCHQDAVRQILARDYLTPPLAGLLTRDLIDTVLPYTSLWPTAGLNRGVILERLLARRAGEAAPIADAALLLDQPLATSFGEAGVPALYLNATDAVSGARVVLSPLLLGRPEDRLVPAPARDFTVAEAAVMSARFPVVTPPARIFVRPPEGTETLPVIRQIVDGGYFDNSGIETVHDILREIRLLIGPYQRPVEVVVLRIGDGPRSEAPPKGMFAAPVSAFMAAWTSRRQLSDQRLRDAFGSQVRVINQSLDPKDANFTVSWFLGKKTFCDIERRIEDLSNVRRQSRWAEPAPPAPAEPLPGGYDPARETPVQGPPMPAQKPEWCDLP